MKTRICLLGIFAFVTLAIAAPRIWTFQTGVTISGDYYSSGDQFVVIKHNGTNCFLRIGDLSSNDQAYVAENQFEQRQARLAAETNQMVNEGMVEFTVKQAKNFPEKMKEHCWMDAEFVEINSDELLELTRNSNDQIQEMSTIAGDNPDDYKTDWREDFLGLHVTDKNGDFYNYCFASKRMDVANDLMKLHSGDKIRLIGYVDNMGASLGDDEYQPWFQIYQIEIIESKAEQDAKVDASNAAYEAQFWGTNNAPQ